MERASEAKSSGKTTTEDVRAQKAREDILLPISRKRTFSESMAALDDGGDDTEVEGDSDGGGGGGGGGGTPARPATKKQTSEEKDDSSETEEEIERVLALHERLVDQGDQLIAAAKLVASRLGSGSGASTLGVRAELLGGSERGLVGKLEAELKASREAVRELKGLAEEMAEAVKTAESKVDASAATLDRIVELLQEAPNSG